MLLCNIQHAIALYLFNLHFYPFLCASFVGRNCNKCSYAIKSHDQNYYITLCILINIIETLELKAHNHKQHPSLRGSTVNSKFSQFLEHQNYYTTYITCAVGICLICPHLPSGTRFLGPVHTYQANPCC